MRQRDSSALPRSQDTSPAERRPAALAHAQERLLLAELRSGATRSQRVAAAFRVAGAFSREYFTEALASVVRRHEGLRTRFVASPTCVTAFVVDEAHSDVALYDLRTLLPPLRADQVDRIIEQQRRAPFDLERGPLLRVAVITTGDDEHVLLFVAHQAILDCTSMGIVTHELSIHYAALAEGRRAELASPLQYPAYVEWHKAWADGPLIREQLAHWHERLSGAPAMLALPTDSPRSVGCGGSAGDLHFELGAELVSAIVAVARRERGTLFMALLAAFATLLGHHADQDDVLVATPSTLRAHPDAGSSVGLFVNMLPLRVDLSGTPSFRTLVARVRAMALDAYANQEAPLERLTPDLSAIQAGLALLAARPALLELPGAVVKELPLPSDVSTFDVSIAATRSSSGLLRCDLTFASDLFSEERMIRLAQALSAFLEIAAESPDRSIGALAAAAVDGTAAPVSVGRKSGGVESPRSAEGIAPRNELEARVAALWREVLGVDELGVAANFFDLGGDSLLALRLLRRLEEELGRRLPLRVIFEGTTVAEMARIVGEQPD